ncbi:MAG: phosphoribosylamine--glycine ligase N-terminal domain-containing protein, partial [Sediminispirochaetaceae bacterium]
MKVLVLGSGAKEHALAWAISKSHVLTGLFVAPGNSGTSEIAENIDNVDIEKPEQVVELCKKLNIDYCLAGNLPALNSGVVDSLQD